MPKMDKKRDVTIDLMRTIGIIAVVASHSNFMVGFMSLFHNPLFMFAAGVFHPHDASRTWKEYSEYLKKRFFRIYLPFVLLTAFLTLIQPLLVRLQLLSGVFPYTLKDMPIKLLTILGMRVEGFSGPCWFLISLLEISIAFETIRVFTQRFSGKVEFVVLLSISVILFPLGIFTNLPRVLDESATMFIWYMLGFYARPLFNAFQSKLANASAKEKMALMAGLCAVCIVLFPCMVLLARTGCEWRGGAIPPLVAFGTAMGIVWSFSLASLLKQLPFAPILALPGKSSFTIMAWHIGAFNLLTILLNGSPCHEGVWSVIYCLWGVVLPTVGKLCWDRILECFPALRRSST